MKTRLMRSRAGSAARSASTPSTWPTISPGVRLRWMPSRAVMQNWQSTAQPTWLETQIVARDQVLLWADFDGVDVDFVDAGDFARVFLATNAGGSPASTRAGALSCTSVSGG